MKSGHLSNTFMLSWVFIWNYNVAIELGCGLVCFVILDCVYVFSPDISMALWYYIQKAMLHSFAQ